MEGIKAQNGEIFYPTYKELANAYGANLESIRKYAARKDWQQKRSNFQARIVAKERARSATRRATQADKFKQDIFLISQTGAYILSAAIKVDLLKTQEQIRANEEIQEQNKLLPPDQRKPYTPINIDLQRMEIISRVTEKLQRAGYASMGIKPNEGPEDAELNALEENYIDELLGAMPRDDLQKIKAIFQRAEKAPVIPKK